MSEIATTGAIVVVGLLVGWLLSVKFHGESRTLESVARIPFNIAWIAVAVFTILGGYYRAGAALLVLWSYFFFSNARRVREGDIEMSPGGWRRRVGNWNPYDRSD
ncbi:hypothetical protein [Natronorubrum sp. DTA7]|uniref:hypothetical protein n=1 Tax=Natronorubrum sp. DTA7 TaxID=3447016 RepID=UPI003F829070